MQFLLLLAIFVHAADLKTDCEAGDAARCREGATRFADHPESVLFYLSLGCELKDKLSCARLKAYQASQPPDTKRTVCTKKFSPLKLRKVETCVEQP